MQNRYQRDNRRSKAPSFNARRSSPNRSNKRPGSNINPSRFINRAVERAVEVPYEPTNKFSDFELGKQLQSTIEHLGYSKPTAIQDQAIAPALQGRDIIGLANTGTGKTAAFLLPIIQKLTKDPVRNSVLILAPTRELAQQIDSEFRRFAGGQKLYSAVCVGGANIRHQIRELQRGPHLIIGTPGRLKDLLNRKVLILNRVNTFVLDEADRMLDMGFVNDIRQLAQLLPSDRQTLCFSATTTPAVEKIVNDFMRDPLVVSVRRGETSDHIDQDVLHARDKTHKIELLTQLLGTEEYEKVLVFGETKFGVQRLADSLTKSNLPAVSIHGNKSQSQRERALKSFRNNEVGIMVATDVAARGLDIPDVTHVINFDQPKAYEDYVHRIGRTGRAGKTGKAITFVNSPVQKRY